jgi:hypothetical protein
MSLLSYIWDKKSSNPAVVAPAFRQTCSNPVKSAITKGSEPGTKFLGEMVSEGTSEQNRPGLTTLALFLLSV